MINNDIYKHTSLPDFGNVLAEALTVMSRSSNKLIIILRNKTDVDIAKAIESFSRENKIKNVNLGLQLSRYLFENDINTVNDYLSKDLNTGNTLIVNNAEILFDSEISISPLKLFKTIARHQVLIVVIDGRIRYDGKFIYGSSSNNDYIQYEELTDTYIIDLNGGLE